MNQIAGLLKNTGALSSITGMFNKAVKPELKSYDTTVAEEEVAKNIKLLIDKYEKDIGDLYKKSLENMFNSITTNKGVLEEKINSFVIDKILASIVADGSVEKSLFAILVSKMDTNTLASILKSSSPDNIDSVFADNISGGLQMGGGSVDVSSVFSNPMSIVKTATNAAKTATNAAKTATGAVATILPATTDAKPETEAKQEENAESSSVENETREIAKILNFYPSDTTEPVVNEKILYIIERSIENVLSTTENTDLIYKKITANIIPNIHNLLKTHIDVLTNNETYMINRFLLKLLENDDIKIGLKQAYNADTVVFKNNIEDKFALKYISPPDPTPQPVMPPLPPAPPTVGGSKKGLNKKTNKNKKSKRSQIQKRKTHKTRK